MSDFRFDLQAPYQPAGDQPSAIAQITNHFDEGQQVQTLLGATGTGKTFTMAHMIQELQKPTLVLSHNKTLAAQLATEFKHFFPHNAVHYFVSYFDYYQPESYLADRDLYIEKEATINQEIEMYRLGALASLVTRPDTIIVASVSSLYGLGDRREFVKNSLTFRVGLDYDFREIKEKLLTMQYHPVQSKIEQGMFDIQGETIDIYSSVEKKLYRLVFDEHTLEYIITKDPISFADQGMIDQVTIWPSSQYLQDMTNQEAILSAIMSEKTARVAELEKTGKMLEANRLDKRVDYDLRMIRETGFTNGIENYSLYFDGRTPGQAPNTIFDYFPDDMLTIVDESHMTIPQLRAMPQADKSRKLSLVDNGFRLPSAIDHRPLNFRELEAIL
ncbi:MAG: DEAD/DEAH box helicase family protein [Candidatus Peribacteria bacterium]|nr:MAG: DEAD/DEAH box helicase family protein [Candidatus Peribacteria bacterium]